MSEKPISFKEILETIPVLQNLNATDELMTTLCWEAYQYQDLILEDLKPLFDDIYIKQKELLPLENKNLLENHNLRYSWILFRNNTWDLFNFILKQQLDSKQIKNLKTICRIFEFSSQIDEHNSEELYKLMLKYITDEDQINNLSLENIETILERWHDLDEKSLANLEKKKHQLYQEILEESNDIEQLLYLHGEITNEKIKDQFIEKIKKLITDNIKKWITVWEIIKFLYRTQHEESFFNILLNELKKQLKELLKAKKLNVYKIQEFYKEIRDNSHNPCTLRINIEWYYVDEIERQLEKKKLEKLNIEELLTILYTIEIYHRVNDKVDNLSSNIRNLIYSKWKTKLLEWEITKQYASEIEEISSFDPEINNIIKLTISDLS